MLPHKIRVNLAVKRPALEIVPGQYFQHGIQGSTLSAACSMHVDFLLATVAGEIVGTEEHAMLME